MGIKSQGKQNKKKQDKKQTGNTKDEKQISTSTKN